VQQNCRLLVVSCPRRKAIQELFKIYQRANWPDCPFSIDILSPDPDIGWNTNLLTYLRNVTEDFILMLLDDNLIDEAPLGEYTSNMRAVLTLMKTYPDIGLVKLQAGGASAPELVFKPWDRLREYDRNPHPFKRTNLIPSMYRRTFLQRLSTVVLQETAPGYDEGRKGAIEFEVGGTRITCDAKAWPERLLGIHRPDVNGTGGNPLLTCVANDAVTGGYVRDIPDLRSRCRGIPGIEAFL
jgi:hypothetical protein